MNLSDALLQQMLPIWIKVLQAYADSPLPYYERALCSDKHASARELIAKFKAYLSSNDPELKQLRQEIAMKSAKKKILTDIVNFKKATTEQIAPPLTPMLLLARSSSLSNASMSTPFGMVALRTPQSSKVDAASEPEQQVLELAMDEVPKVAKIRNKHNHARLGSYDHILACLIANIENSIALALKFSHGEGTRDSNSVMLQTLKYLCMLAFDHSIYQSPLTTDKKAIYSVGSEYDFSVFDKCKKYSLFYDQIESTVGNLYSVDIPQLAQGSENTSWLTCDLNRYYTCGKILRVLEVITEKPLELRSFLEREMMDIHKAGGKNFAELLIAFANYTRRPRCLVLPPDLKRARTLSETGSDYSSEVGTRTPLLAMSLSAYSPMNGSVLPSPYIGGESLVSASPRVTKLTL